jgi:hypothetical protein
MIPTQHSETYDHDEESEAALHEELRRLRAELPQMRKENRRLTAFLQDAVAFIRKSHREGLWNDNIILATLVHDITALANDEPCFVPKVTGYAQREQERKLAQTGTNQ